MLNVEIKFDVYLVIANVSKIYIPGEENFQGLPPNIIVFQMRTLNVSSLLSFCSVKYPEKKTSFQANENPCREIRAYNTQTFAFSKSCLFFSLRDLLNIKLSRITLGITFEACFKRYQHIHSLRTLRKNLALSNQHLLEVRLVYFSYPYFLNIMRNNSLLLLGMRKKWHSKKELFLCIWYFWETFRSILNEKALLFLDENFQPNNIFRHSNSINQQAHYFK